MIYPRVGTRKANTVGCSKKGLMTAGLLLVTLASVSPSWAQSASENAQPEERIRATYKTVSPGTATSEDALRGRVRSEPMAVDSGRPKSANRSLEQTNVDSMPQTCKTLQAEIDHKIKANNVVDYTVKVLPTAKAEEVVERNRGEPGKVEIVGYCGQDDYRVVYRRN